MRIVSGILMMFILLFGTSATMAQKSRTVTVQYSFANTAKGFDHLTRVVVYVDHQKLTTSKSQKQSMPGKVTFDLPEGEHHILIVAEAFYEGRWEERTVENNYSIDCLYSNTLQIKKNRKIVLVFDLDQGTIVKKE
jgi:hypothetical protein